LCSLSEADFAAEEHAFFALASIESEPLPQQKDKPSLRSLSEADFAAEEHAFFALVSLARSQHARLPASVAEARSMSEPASAAEGHTFFALAERARCPRSLRQPLTPLRPS
jgi:hypothetical protein